MGAGIDSDDERLPAGDHATIARWLFERLPAVPSAARHRVVHGGLRHAASEAPEAREALDLFAYRILREAGSLIAALGGIDTLVFTGGIGEHAAQVRAAVCRRLAFAGVSLDEAANARAEDRLAVDGAGVEIRIVPADEEREIARSASRLLGEPDNPKFD